MIINSIGILEDDFFLRCTIEDFISYKLRYKICFSVGSYVEMIDASDSCTTPDLVLLDVHLDDVYSVDVMQEIKRIFPGVYIIVITGDNDEKLILECIKKGAASFLLKPFTIEHLQKAIDNIERTGSFLDPETLTKLMSQISSTKEEKDFNTLTTAEKNALEYIKKGLTYKEMAEAMNISYNTVNFHLKNIYTKLDVRSKTELLAKYL